MSQELACVLSILIVSLCYTGVNAQCSPINVAKCIGPIAIYSTSSNRVLPSESINEICSDLSNATKCMSDLGCKDSDNAAVGAWAAMRDSFGYVCGDSSAKDVVVSNGCLKSSSVQQTLQQCNTVYLGAVAANNATCATANTYLKCSEDGVSICGNLVTRVYVSFVYNFVKPQASLMGCNIKQPDVTLSAAVQTPSFLLLVAMFVYSFRV